MKTNQSFRSKWKHAASVVTSRKYSESRRGSTKSYVSSATDAVSLAASIGGRSRRDRKKHSQVESNHSVRAEYSRKGTFKKRYEEEIDKLKQLLVKLEELNNSISTATVSMRDLQTQHQKKIFDIDNQVIGTKNAISGYQERIGFKEEIAEDNRLHIAEWRKIVFTDEVRRAYNFILKSPNPNLTGVAPEEVFSEEAMARFYSAKRHLRSTDRRRILERRGQVRIVTITASLTVVITILNSIKAKAEEKFRRDVLRSVGMKAGENTAAAWLNEIREKAEFSLAEAPALPTPPPTPPPKDDHQVPRHWLKYRLPYYTENRKDTSTVSPIRSLLNGYAVELTSLTIDESVDDSYSQRIQRLRTKRDKQFEIERMLPPLSDSPLPKMLVSGVHALKAPVGELNN